MSEIKTYDEFTRRYAFDPVADKLGEGGFGIVFKAYDTVLDRYVAVKISSVKAESYSLMDEVSAVAGLTAHPNIARYEPPCYRLRLGFAESDFAIMQYYPAGNLAQYVASERPKGEKLRAIASGILEGLAFLHDTKGGKSAIVHRDLKPSNILMALPPDRLPVPKIADFGLAKVSASGKSLSNSGAMSGRYASPEQADGEKLDWRTDLWSYGSVLYFLCTGEHPFRAPDGAEGEVLQSAILKQVRKAALPNLSGIESPYREMIETCWQRDVEQRAQSAEVLLKMLNNGKKIEDPPAPKPHPPTPNNKRRMPWLWLSLGLAGVLLLLWLLPLMPVGDSDPFSDQMVPIPGGSFQMGSMEGEDEQPIHSVRLDGFMMSKYEVTQAQWRAVMGDNPSHFSGCNECPVENVSWDNAQAFIQKLNETTGKKYRLPTEAEWEYACRAGTRTPFHTGQNLTTEQANYDGSYPYKNFPKGQYRAKTTPVGSFSPNEWGLYDMHGNVWEWCADWWAKDYYARSPDANPLGPSRGDFRVLRGGSWGSSAKNCRAAYRGSNAPVKNFSYGGFRLAL